MWIYKKFHPQIQNTSHSVSLFNLIHTKTQLKAEDKEKQIIEESFKFVTENYISSYFAHAHSHKGNITKKPNDNQTVTTKTREEIIHREEINVVLLH